MLNLSNLLSSFERKEKTPRDELILLATLLIITVLLRLPFLSSEPFVKDEALYARMIDEFSAHPSWVPTFLGYEVGWRPFLFFAIYCPPIQLLTHLPIPLEFAYRLPSFFFALLCIIVLYKLIKELYNNIDLAFTATLIFSIAPLTVLVNNTILVDTLLLFFILSSLLCYVRGNKSNDRYFLLAGVFAFCAFMVKTVVAFAIPVLALAYICAHGRKKLTNPYFILSLIGIPLAIALYYLMFSDKSIIIAEYSFNVTQKLVNDTPLPLRLIRSTAPIVILNAVLVGFYALGLPRLWKFDRQLFVWVAITIFACLGGYYMPWYFLPVIPVFSIAAALVFLNDSTRLDRLSLAALAVLTLTSIILVPIFLNYENEAVGQRVAGNFLSGKDRVLIAGDYAPSLLFYKIHNESLAARTFCWMIVSDSNWNNSMYLHAIVYNFQGLDKNFSYNSRVTDMFWKKEELKPPCNLTSFDYLALVGIPNKTAATLTDFTPIAFFDENITVYSRKDLSTKPI